jgi:hypothetical protein
LAEAILGPGSVTYGHAALPARLIGHAIVIPKGHLDLNFAVAHECAEWALRELVVWTGGHAAKERAANSIAAAMLAPPIVVTKAYARHGEDVRALAKVFGLSQTSTILRLAEVEGRGRAVVTLSGHVLSRRIRQPTASLVLAARARTATPGLARTRLRGGIDDGRVALRVR